MEENNIPCFNGSCSEIYLEKCFQDKNLAPKLRLPNPKKLGETSLMFLVHPTLMPEEIENVIAMLRLVFDKINVLA